MIKGAHQSERNLKIVLNGPQFGKKKKAPATSSKQRFPTLRIPDVNDLFKHFTQKKSPRRRKKKAWKHTKIL